MMARDRTRAVRGRPRRRRIFAEIWEVVARIPRGRVATYGQIARMARLPGGARMVGWAMRALPEDLRIGGRPVPWHRVINAQGRISLRRDACGEDGSLRQAAALRREGIAVSRDGALDLGRHVWRGERVREGSPREPRSGGARSRRGGRLVFPASG